MGLRGFFGFFFVLLSTFSAAQDSIANCQANWVEYSHLPYVEVGFPEMNVTYYRFTFLSPAPGTHLEIQGLAPKSRYIAFSLYDQYNQEPLSSLPDPDIFPDTIPKPGLEAGQSYTLKVGNFPSDTPNALIIPENRDRSFEIWYRVYVPQIDPLGGVPLPVVRALDARGNSVTCPAANPRAMVVKVSLENIGRLPPVPTPEGEIFFYATTGQGIFPNLDNRYMAARLDFKAGPFALFRFRPPTTPGTSNYVLGMKEDMRYWSFCISSAKSTTTSGCLIDSQIKTGPDGYAEFLVGPEEYEGRNIAAICKEKGLSFLPKGKNFLPLLLYRNLLTTPGFKGAIDYATQWPPLDPLITKKEAALTLRQNVLIGDYAPQGRLLSATDLDRLLASR